ncbi:MAG TPA: ABC transporter permease [Longimicrobiaceae bacterium]|nr:ABC transporter permease [Longimicrobiaceae bacterium]
MGWLEGMQAKVHQWLDRPESEDRLGEEIRFHIQMETEKNSRSGMSSEDARRQAILAFGGIEGHKEEMREGFKFPLLEDLWRDIRFGIRSLRRSPWLILVVIGTLGLGIGTSVMIHDAGRALASEAVPFQDPDQLVLVDVVGEREGSQNPLLVDFEVWQSEADSRITLGAYTFGNYFVGDGSRTFDVAGSRVTGDFFSVLAIDPLLGRTFIAEETSGGGGPVAVIAERLWEGKFGSDPAIIGRTLRIGGKIHTVVGVVPAGLQYPAGADLWIPLVPSGAEAAELSVNVIGRLAPDVTEQQAQTALTTIQRGVSAERTSGEAPSRVSVEALTGQPDEAARTALLILKCATLALLLISAANAAGLMLTRAIERRQEIAIRASLGAGRGRIVRHLLVESALVAIAAGAFGLIVSHLGIAGLRSAVPLGWTRHVLGWERFGLDWNTVAFALVLSALTGLTFGIVPAIAAVRGDLAVHLREGAPTSTPGRRGRRLARLVLSTEVALALTLLLTAGLLSRSLLGLIGADAGFEASGVLTAEWSLPPDPDRSEEGTRQTQNMLLERLGWLPGVLSAGLVSNLPMSRTGWSRAYRPAEFDPATEEVSASWRPATPGYLGTLGVSILRGRRILESDAANSPRVAVISEGLAERHWDDDSPIGNRLEVEGESWTIVGVAEDVHNFGVAGRADATIYVPQEQFPTRSGFLAVRVAGDPAEYAAQLRQEVWNVDPNIALGEMRTLERVVEDYYADERLMALLMGVFAAIALFITVVTLYAIVAHSIARQRREIGIRLALGARPREVLFRAMSQGVLWVVFGMLAGLLLATGMAQVLASQLYGISPLDPVVFTLMPAGLLIIAIIASYVPAREAMSVDPVESLRSG